MTTDFSFNTFLLHVADRAEHTTMVSSYISTVQRGHNMALVTKEEAQNFCSLYVDYYFTRLARGLIIPPNASLYFEGTFLKVIL